MPAREHGEQSPQRPHAAGPDPPPLVPARMVNEYVYCPRLAYMEWVQGEWADSSDTVEGTHGHRRVNRKGGTLPPPDDISDTPRLHARSVTLSSERLGLIARMDLVESIDSRVAPVDYKHGKRPHVERGAYEPERVQLCVQGLILQEHGNALLSFAYSLLVRTWTVTLNLAFWFSGNAARPVEHVNLVLGLGMFGLNTGFFGLLAELVVQRQR